MRPDRLVVGEVQEAESLKMLLSLNSGLPDSVHARSMTALWTANTRRDS